jgi:phosphoserine phosphatase RsbU/P
MSERPAAYQLGIYLSGLFVFVMALHTYWSFSYTKDLIHRNYENYARAISSNITGAVNEKVVTAGEVCVNLAQHIRYIHNFEQLNSSLEDIVKRYEFIYTLQVKIHNYTSDDEDVLFISERDGGKVVSSFAVNGEYHCALLNEIIPDPGRKAGAFLSKPYRCSKDSSMVVLYYQPFSHSFNEKQGVLEGSVSCEISLESIHNLILGTSIGKNGFAFLISEDGTFITHPMEEFILNRTLFNLPHKVFKGKESEIRKVIEEDFGSVTVYPNHLNFARSLSFHSKIKNTGWILLVTMPYYEINRELYLQLIRLIILLVIGVAGIFISVFLISNKVMQPLTNVTNEIHSFSNEYHDHELQVMNEAEALAHSLKRLRKTYEKFRLNEAMSREQSKRYQQDLLMASEIQKSIIPSQGMWSMNDGSISLYSVFRPANVVSGDLYDFFMIDERNLLITIGDASGKGVPAALFMGVAHTFIKSFSIGNSAKTIVRKVNKELCRNNSNQFFMTLFLGILDINDGTLKYCNAGHTFPYLIRHDGSLSILSETHGLPLGLYSERNYEYSVIQLQLGDMLFLYTDGLTDQTDDSGQHFGETALQNLVRNNSFNQPKEIAENILAYLDEFRGNNVHPDDLSLMIFRFGDHSSMIGNNEKPADQQNE